MHAWARQGWTHAAVWLLAAGLLAGCASGTRIPAPVEDRNAPRAAAPAPAPAAQPAAAPPVVAAVEPARPLPGAEQAGRPGYYTVRPGDTLIRIALDSGQNWRDLVRWNSIENPNLIEVGQVLRVAPPVASGAAEVAVARPVAPGAAATAAPIAPAASAPRTATVTAAVPPAAIAAAAPAEDELQWGWPAPGNSTVLAGFDEVRNKGLDIGGRPGDPVLASADGRVVYAGAGLRGYGNLIILKHNNTYLTAYAHNQTLLVKEDQNVRKGQKIAEMGSSDADRVKLHFEIRRQGKPVDPARYLPAR